MSTLEHDPANDQRLRDFKADLSKFGRAEGSGDNSRPAAAISACGAAQQGVIGKDDAKELWSLFQESAAKARSVPYVKAPSFGVQVSKFKNFIVLGSIPALDALDVLSRTADVLKALAADEATKKELKGSTYDLLIKVAKEQIKREANAMTDDEIRDCVMSVRDKPEPDEQKELEKLQKRMETLHERFPASRDALERANDQIRERVTELASSAEQEEQEAQEQQLVALLSNERVRAKYPELFAHSVAA